MKLSFRLEKDLLSYSSLESFEEFVRLETQARRLLFIMGNYLFALGFALLLLFIAYTDQYPTFPLLCTLALTSFTFYFLYILSEELHYLWWLKSLSATSPIVEQSWALYVEAQNSQARKFTLLEELAHDFSLDPKAFLKLHFSKCSPGFINFYSLRALIRGDVNLDFIAYSLSIPKRKELSVDSLRKILLAYQPQERREVVDLNPPFKKYSLTQIEQLFTSPFNHTFIPSLASFEDIPLCRNFIDLEVELKEITLPLKIKRISELKFKGLRFKLLRSLYDYDKAGSEFSNCSRTYFNYPGLYMVTAYSGLRPEICLSIRNSRVYEVKGVKNRPHPLKDEITLYLNNYLRSKESPYGNKE